MNSMMNVLVVDCEASGPNKANPFGRANQLCCIGLFDGITYTYHDIEHSGLPYGEALGLVAQQINEAEIVIGHNLKYDLNWLRRYIPNLSVHSVWDTQLFEYIASDQTWILPSLSDSLVSNGFPAKSDYIKKEYWDKGLHTMDVPSQVLREYNEYDCRGTYNLYLKQLARLNASQAALFQLHCDDLLVLQEMEFNGILFDMDESKRLQAEAEAKYSQIIKALNDLVPNTGINWNSNDHLSAVLYGGTVTVDVRETVVKQFKKGPKNVERWGKVSSVFPRLVDPVRGSERSGKEGYYFVNEPCLRSLRPRATNAKKLVQLVLDLAEVEKLLNTYYIGLPKLIAQMDWAPGVIHGSLNQCITKTGRLSSSRPNLQNFSGVIKPLFRSRYAEAS